MTSNLTPAAFDALSRDVTVMPRDAKPEKLWGAPAIARALGVSVATVYRLAAMGDCPISRPAGRYFARRSELDQWLRGAAA